MENTLILTISLLMWVDVLVMLSATYSIPKTASPSHLSVMLLATSVGTCDYAPSTSSVSHYSQEICFYSSYKEDNLHEIITPIF